MDTPSALARRVRAVERRPIAASAAAVLALSAAVAAGASWSVAALAAWDAVALTYLALVWPTIGPLDATGTADVARNEEGSPRSSEALLLAAGTASLIAVGFVLARAARDHDLARLALTVLAAGSLTLAWACVHSVYTLRYARLYHTPPVGGLAFAEADPPNYRDFAYVAFTIGMCFQVSDTAISKKPLRRAAVHHALISYLFAAVTVATAVSVVAALLG
jgi:uncharacterized membrane protein